MVSPTKCPAVVLSFMPHAIVQIVVWLFKLDRPWFSICVCDFGVWGFFAYWGSLLILTSCELSSLC